MSLEQTVSELRRRMASLFLVDRDKIMANVKSRLPELKGRSRSIDLELAQVRSYLEPEKAVCASKVPGVAVQSDTPQWGIVVGNTLYHLIIQNDENAEFSDSTKGPPIEFRGVSPAKNKIRESKIVGEIKYDHEQLLEIGEALIKSFPTSHHLFWNCQMFAQCFLSLITDGGSFEQYDTDCLMLIS
jgi:hypothetical protein